MEFGPHGDGTQGFCGVLSCSTATAKGSKHSPCIKSIIYYK